MKGSRRPPCVLYSTCCVHPITAANSNQGWLRRFTGAVKTTDYRTSAGGFYTEPDSTGGQFSSDICSEQQVKDSKQVGFYCK